MICKIIGSDLRGTLLISVSIISLYHIGLGSVVTGLRVAVGVPIDIPREVAGSLSSMTTTSAETLLVTHSNLLARVRDAQRNHRRHIRAILPTSPPHDLLKLSPSPAPVEECRLGFQPTMPQILRPLHLLDSLVPCDAPHTSGLLITRRFLDI
jgi:hypothetical protein